MILKSTLAQSKPNESRKLFVAKTPHSTFCIDEKNLIVVKRGVTITERDGNKNTV